MKLEVNVYKEKNDINVIIKDGLFHQHNVITIGKSQANAVSRTIAKYLKDSGFLS